LVARDGTTTVVVEVRTITGDGDPLDAVDATKRRRVSSLARRVGARRVDFLGVALRPDAVVFHWLPG
jgi:Holliday junction resolvase-like predicted endonuclease